jgi:hypothetical protein
MLKAWVIQIIFENDRVVDWCREKKIKNRKSKSIHFEKIEETLTK